MKSSMESGVLADYCRAMPETTVVTTETEPEAPAAGETAGIVAGAAAVGAANAQEDAAQAQATADAAAAQAAAAQQSAMDAATLAAQNAGVSPEQAREIASAEVARYNAERAARDAVAGSQATPAADTAPTKDEPPKSVAKKKPKTLRERWEGL